jgi:hypothetical protein
MPDDPVAGIGFVAVITASITATFVENARERLMDEGESDVVRELKEISARLAALEARQDGNQSTAPGVAAPAGEDGG